MEENIILAYKEEGEDLVITALRWQDIMTMHLGYLYVGTDSTFLDARKLTEKEKIELSEFFLGNLQLTRGIVEYKAKLKDMVLPVNELLENTYVVRQEEVVNS